MFWSKFYLNSVSFEKFIIDEELSFMCQRIKRGETINEYKLAYEVIDACAYDLTFFIHEHTFGNFRRELMVSALSTRDTYEEWVDKGRTEVAAKARQVWHRYFSEKAKG